MSMNDGQVLYISRLAVQNIRCFRREEMVIDFTQPQDKTPSWTLILGDNGTGKTSLLRCIAMCLCDETNASGLLTELTGDMIRHGQQIASIELELKSSSHPMTKYTITTTLTKTASGGVELQQEVKPEKNFPRDQVFACGYGAAYGTIGSDVYEKYSLLYSVLSLFDYHARLWNPENALFRISREGIDLDDLLARINRILMLPPGSTQLDASGLRLRGPWGDFVPAGALGDGYAATLSWICDLFGWSLLAKRKSFGPDLRGIVLLDEIEQHLHPSWQRAIIRLLVADFPGIQFIATTHAPLIAIGSSSLSNECCQLVLLEQEGDRVVSSPSLEPPRDRRADQVLTSYLFGLHSTTSQSVARDVARYAQLRAKSKPTASEKVEIGQLSVHLWQVLGTAETPLQQTVREAVMTTLRQLAREALKNGQLTSEALDFETRRQLQELFGERDTES